MGDIFNNKMSRRSFVKYSAIGLAGLSLPAIKGCSKTNHDGLPNLYGTTRYHDKVFERTNLFRIQLKNRILSSAVSMNLSSGNEKPTDLLARKYIELCEGGVGGIITGAVAVQKNGASAFEHALLIDKDEYIRDYKRMAHAAHGNNTPIIMQLGHDGPITRRVFTGEGTVSASAIGDKNYNEEIPRILSEPEINEIIRNFVSAIGRAQRADFDGVQIFASHGGLLSAFLSPNSNRRNDKWGGTTENRFRIIKEIFEDARRRYGNFPIIIKMNSYDFQPGGMNIDEAIRIAVLLENAGCDGIKVSCGVPGDGFSTVRVNEFPTNMLVEHTYQYKNLAPFNKKILKTVMPLISWMYRYEPIFNYNVTAAKRIKEKISIPVIVVGGIRRLHEIEQIIGRNMADYVSMARPFIIEPDIVNKFRTQSQSESQCINCGYCILALEEMPVSCFYGQLP